MFLIFLQAREEFHAHVAATRGQLQMQSDLMDDNELLIDDRELDNDLNGKYNSLIKRKRLIIIFKQRLKRVICLTTPFRLQE